MYNKISDFIITNKHYENVLLKILSLLLYLDKY